MEICKICNKETKNKIALAGHIGSFHKISMSDYIIQTEFNGIAPKCKLCDNMPSFVRGKNIFRNFCKEHANEGRSEWSKENMSFDPSWKKGLSRHTNESIRRHSEKMKGENNHFYKNMPRFIIDAASEARKTKCVLGNERFIDRADEKFKSKYNYSEIEYKHSKEKIKIYCNKHNISFYQRPNDHLSGYVGCPKCSNNGTSKKEKQVVEWLKTVYSGEIVENSRSIIGPKELDIYIPEKRFAIEYNGLYWHSGDKIDKKAHLNKTLACKEKDIRLFHIFSDEWRDKGDIVISMIKYRLGMFDRKVPARKCVIEVLDRKAGSQFFTDTHISGDNRAAIYIGLKYGGEVVSAISLKKPIQKKYGNVLEIARFSNALNTTVQGGFGKLFSYVKEYAKQLGYTGILTYADRRFGDGDTYSKNGFFFLSSSPVDYWYSEGIDRYFRFKYRAQKPLSEKQVAEQNGVYPVYGCGSNTYIYRFCF